MSTVKNEISRANPNSLPAQLSSLRDSDDKGLGDMLDSMAPAGTASTSGWDTGIAVSSDTVTLSEPGMVVAVDATTGSATGGKTQTQSGTPAAGEVDVNYDADGIATLTFNGTDAVTECAVLQLKAPSGLQTKMAENLFP